MTDARHFLVFLVLTGAETCVTVACTTARSAPSGRSTAETFHQVGSNAVRSPSSSAASYQSPPSTSAIASGPVGNSASPASPAEASVKCPAINDKPEPGVECGELNCLAFSSEVAAFQHLLKSEPQVLGIGESHAPKGIEGVHSAARRFGELLLPALCGRSHSIVLELWLPRNDCGDNRVQQVKKAQEPVTRTQAKSNQDDYVTLGHVAKRFGIAPSALVPTCDEYQSILDAGPDGVERMLELVGSRAGERIVEELQRHANQGDGPSVVAYGGALHNDAEPDREHARYSYGPRLLEQTHGKYIELDLIVPEFVKDTDIWKRQPWYSAFKKAREPSKTKLYQFARHSFALVFATTSNATHSP
jgi:hypothetical protein